MNWKIFSYTSMICFGVAVTSIILGIEILFRSEIYCIIGVCLNTVAIILKRKSKLVELRKWQ